MGDAVGQSAAGTATGGVQVRWFVAGRTALNWFVGERARLAQRSSFGSLPYEDAAPTARGAWSGRRPSRPVAGCADRSSRPEDLDLHGSAAQRAGTLRAGAACVAVARAAAAVDVVTWAGLLQMAHGFFGRLWHR